MTNKICYTISFHFMCQQIETFPTELSLELEKSCDIRIAMDRNEYPDREHCLSMFQLPNCLKHATYRTKKDDPTLTESLENS